MTLLQRDTAHRLLCTLIQPSPVSIIAMIITWPHISLRFLKARKSSASQIHAHLVTPSETAHGPPLTPVHPLPYPATCICFDTKPRLFSRYKASGGRRVVLAQRNPIRSNSFDVKADPCLTVMYVTVAGSLSYEASIAQCNKFEKFI